MDEKTEVVFTPGCFDSFEGTQEELDGLIAEIKRAVKSGDLLKNSRPVDPDDPMYVKVLSMLKEQETKSRREN